MRTIPGPKLFAAFMLRNLNRQLLTCMSFAGAAGLSQTASSQLLSATSWCTQTSRQVTASLCIVCRRHVTINTWPCTQGR